MIETVRGRLDDALRAAIVAFWEQAGALTGGEAEQRLPEVICIARDATSGAVTATSTATVETVAALGDQLLWVYRGLTSDDAALREPLVAATYRALSEADAPAIGVLRLIADRAELDARPAAVWDDPPFLFAGYLDDGRQLRVAYFDGAQISV